MKSIRLSLVVYFLALLALALGAVGVLVAQTTYQTLLAKKETTRQLVEAQYRERCRQEEAKLDEALLYQARTLVRLMQFQSPWSRLHYRELYLLGLLTAGQAPSAQALLPVWIAEGTRTPLAGELYHSLGHTEIKFDESDLHADGEGAPAEYFQIDSVWGSSYRSHSMGNHAFPVDPSVFTTDQVLNWEFDDTRLGSGLTVRRVTLKAPAARVVPFFPPSHPGHRPQPDTASEPGPGRGSRRSTPPPGAESPFRPAILIQCACATSKRDSALAAFLAQRDADCARLDAETDASLVLLRNRLLLVSLITFAATAAGTLGLVRLGLAPLHRLSDAVSRVSPRDFRLPLDPRRLPHELTVISQRLTQTLDMLKRAFAREKQAAADISHELRTPLAALMTTTEVALRKPRTPEEYREMLEDCRASGQQMSRLVERLLALARLDAGADTLRLQELDVAVLAEQCASLVRPLAEARQLSLQVTHTGPTPFTADPDKLREVLTNLLHNAIQYNRPEGSVEVRVGRDNGVLEMEVRDTGIGMSAEARKHIFERFYRVDPARQADGLHGGLGLSIVKGYIDLMGGTIAVDSTEGQGSTFRVRLPASPR